MKPIIKVILVFILFTVSVSIYLLVNNNEEKNSIETIEYRPFCGTKSDNNNDSIKVKGKLIFNSYCAACHKKDSDSIEPGLRKVIEKYKEGNKNFYDYLKGNKRHSLLFINYSKHNRNDYPYLTKEDAIAIQKYLEPVTEY